MNQTHDKKFHCTYLLHYYPFDTQICRVDTSSWRSSRRYSSSILTSRYTVMNTK